MINIDSEVLADSVANIENLSNDYEDILNRISKLKDELEDSSESEKIFPHIIEQVEIMKDNLEKLGIESVSNLATSIENILTTFEEADENIKRGIGNGNKV